MLGTPSPAATHAAEWMLEAALGTIAAPDAFEGMILRLREQGVQIDRAHLAYTTLHPLNRGIGATWTTTGGIELEHYSYERDQDSAGWFNSPIHHIVVNRISRLRRRLKGPGAMVDFDILREFAAQGLTDYYLVTQPFDSFNAAVDIREQFGDETLTGMTASFATRRESGFSDEEIETLSWLTAPLGMAVKMADQRQVALNLANCYIGRDAGPRVLGGEIRRGDFATTPAIVWLSDLRDSTALSATLPRDEYVATINAFFDCTAGSVEAEDGEVLTFIGDGALAIFSIDAMGEAGARQAAWRAALRAQDALGAFNDARRSEGRGDIGWGVALHAGALDYGNIGSKARHSWSVIGPVVNETARLEGLTKSLGEPIVASRSFVDGLAGDWRPLGAHELRGVAAPMEAFAPPRRSQRTELREAV